MPRSLLPGTGKTTVAEIYGRILKDLGYLSKGEVIERKASQLVGSVVGKTEEIMNSLLDQAKGCVLIIDEAYSLTKDGSYGAIALEILVHRVQGYPGEDIAVILCG